MKLQVSNALLYSVRAVAHIAVHADKDRPINGTAVAKTLGIPTGFLLRLLTLLAKHGILESLKGPNGGFWLARKPERISLLQISNAVEQSVGSLDTPPVGNHIGDQLDSLFGSVSEHVRDRFSDTTIAGLLESVASR